MALNTTICAVGNHVSRCQEQEEARPDRTIALCKDVLLCIFLKLDTKALFRCELVCRRWNNLLKSEEGDKKIWNTIAFQSIFGKRVWEEHVGVDIGVEPRYRIGGREISWREACQMQSQPSFFKVNGGSMPEIDFLVPKTINGFPTTINRLLQVIAKSKSPLRMNLEFTLLQRFLIKYGDIPIDESYFARMTFTIDEETYFKKPEDRIEAIEKKGQGLYRLPSVIEFMIFTFISYQVGLPCGYRENPMRYTQCIETIEYDRFEFPLKCGVSGLPPDVCINICINSGNRSGAGALRMF